MTDRIDAETLAYLRDNTPIPPAADESDALVLTEPNADWPYEMRVEREPGEPEVRFTITDGDDSYMRTGVGMADLPKLIAYLTQVHAEWGGATGPRPGSDAPDARFPRQRLSPADDALEVDWAAADDDSPAVGWVIVNGISVGVTSDHEDGHPIVTLENLTSADTFVQVAMLNDGANDLWAGTVRGE